MRFLLVGSVLLAGCAGGSGDYPSLAIRDAERERGAFAVPDPQESQPPAPDPLPAETDARIAALLDAARAADRAFTEALPAARSRVAAARGAGVTSPAWASAQVALGDLSSKRSLTSVPVADLEQLGVEIQFAGQSQTAITAAYQEALGHLREQDEALASLAAQLRQ